MPKSRRDFENLQRSSLGEKGSQHDFQAQRCFHKSLSNHILGFRNCIILHLGIIPSVGMTACCGALGRQDGLEDGRVALRTWQTSELELGKLLCRQLTPAANPVEEPARRFRPCTREFNRCGRCWKYLSSVCRVFVECLSTKCICGHFQVLNSSPIQIQRPTCRRGTRTTHLLDWGQL